MKAFKECNRRKNGRCVPFDKKCTSETILDIGNKDSKKTCWRMCIENVYYMQCPDCESRLWFDAHTSNILGDIFYCPKCDKEVSREDSLVLAKTLGEMLKKSEEILKNWHKGPFECMPSPREFDQVHREEFQVRRLTDMIIRLAKGQKIQMNRNSRGLES